MLGDALSEESLDGGDERLIRGERKARECKIGGCQASIEW